MYLSCTQYVLFTGFCTACDDFLIPTNVTMGHVFWTLTNVMEVKTVQMAVMRGQKLVESMPVAQ